MPFTLKSIQVADAIKIVEDASCNERLHRRLLRLHILQLPKTWALNTHSNSYLILLPGEIREDSAHLIYFLFYKNRFFEFRKIDFFGNRISAHNYPKDLESERKDIESIFTEAIAVHGAFGDGPNSVGKTLDTVIKETSIDYFEPVFVQDDIQPPPM